VATGWVGDEDTIVTHTVDQGFVVEESGGSWGKAEPTPGIGSTPGGSSVDGLSCWSAGNCLAAVSEGAGLVHETNGSWGSVQDPQQLIPGWVGTIDSVSCGSAGNCAVGGYMVVADETDGSWGTAQVLLCKGRPSRPAATSLSLRCRARPRARAPRTGRAWIIPPVPPLPGGRLR
jgi:hypothetical protein